jgi:hypothetical protein
MEIHAMIYVWLNVNFQWVRCWEDLLSGRSNDIRAIRSAEDEITLSSNDLCLVSVMNQTSMTLHTNTAFVKLGEGTGTSPKVKKLTKRKGPFQCFGLIEDTRIEKWICEETVLVVVLVSPG